MTRHQSPSKTRRLRSLLGTPGCVLTAGAHDALSARLAEQAGFDAIWASGFGVSLAQHSLSDANILTMTENLEAARRMNEAGSLPVIADCDNGYGNAINVMRTVREYEGAGIAAVCIEDNEFPKRCSFYEGVQRQVVPIEEHVGKIKAALAARTDPAFMVIARCEALILGLGQAEALKRAKAYARAGADALLVHSKAKTFNELRDFAAAYRRSGLRTPLVSVPTTYPSVELQELENSGFKIVIFANQAVRASLKAMRETLTLMRRTGSAASVAGRIAAMEEVYDLVGVEKLRREEHRFVPRPEPATAVILAAGFERALLPLTADRPKGMLDLGGRPVLAHQVERLREAGVDDVVVVRGYKKEAVALPGVRLVDNDDYADTSEAYSWLAAARGLKGRTLLLYGDILFDSLILRKLLACSGHYTLVVDVARGAAAPDRSSGGPAGPPPGAPAPSADWVVFDHKSIPKDPLRAFEAPGRIRRIGQNVPSGEAHGEFTGMALFSARGAERIRRLCASLAGRAAGPFHEAATPRLAKMTDVFQELMDRGEVLHSMNVSGGWFDIDSLQDYARAWGRL